MGFALVNKTIASLRKEPSRESELTDEDFYGMTVEILDEPIRDWYLVKTHYRYTGYVHSSELLIDDARVKAWEKADKQVILRSCADVLTMPKVQGIHMITLSRGAVISVLEKADQDGWVKAGLCDGRQGYIKEKSLGEYITGWSLKDEKKLRRNIVNTALLYMGTQYRWGGRSPFGIDCSGLCSAAYMLNGVTIYRDAKIMEGFPIHEITYEQLKPCDLLFFPGHVAMCIGNCRYVHSTGKNGSDGVVINSLDPKAADYREDLPSKLRAVGSIF